MNPPIAALDAREIGKRQLAERLIRAVVTSGWTFLIVKSEVTLRDRLLKDPIFLTRCGSTYLYAIGGMETISAGVRCLLKMRLWHKPVFHALVVTQGTRQSILDLCREDSMRIKRVEDKIVGDTMCYIEPLDDVLEIYGDEHAAAKILFAVEQVPG